MAPPKKKAKVAPRVLSVEPKALAPIIFSIPGQTPDVLITAFGQPYHVHSTILRLHSHYFRRFLDSPEKSHCEANGNFKYQYTSVVDEDGEWGLEPVGPDNDKVRVVSNTQKTLLVRTTTIYLSDCACLLCIISEVDAEPITRTTWKHFQTW